MAEKTPADVLEEAADLLLIRGVRRDGRSGDVHEDGPLCVLGALHGVSSDLEAVDEAFDIFRERLFPDSGDCGSVFDWNDNTDDDFEVIDTLRHVAKQLRNEAVV